MDEQKKIIPFASTGLASTVDEVERSPLKPGMSFLVHRIQTRNSPKFGLYAVFDGVTGDEDEFHAYTTSAVIVEQAQAILKAFSQPEAAGVLDSYIYVKVGERKSPTTGRTYLTLE